MTLYLAGLPRSADVISDGRRLADHRGDDFCNWDEPALCGTPWYPSG
jgi:hypothetical protein